MQLDSSSPVQSYSREVDNDSESLDFNTLFNHFNIGVIMLDEEWQIKQVNSTIEKMIGFNRLELKGKKLIDLLHPDDNLPGNTALSGLSAPSTGNIDIERRLIDKLGQARWFRLIVNQVKNDVSASCYLLMVEDISERKETEMVKDAFVDMVAHELKNPLMAVISALRLAKKEGQFPDVLPELVSIASDGAESLWAILENLLEVSRERAGRLKLSPVSSDISHLIKQVIVTVPQTLIHRIIMNIPENLPAIVVDPARFHLVLRNLVDNAIKYSPKGGEIEIFVIRSGEEIIVGVRDQGIGISKSNLQNLFQPFERLGVTNTVGSGLGLAVCRLLVTYHNGRIWVESETGKGSTFYFAIPLNYLKQGSQS